MKQRRSMNPTAGELMQRIGKALRKPGIAEEAVFRREPKAYARRGDVLLGE